MKIKDLVQRIERAIQIERHDWENYEYGPWWGEEEGSKATLAAKRLAWDGMINLENVEHKGERITGNDIENYLKREGRFFSWEGGRRVRIGEGADGNDVVIKG